MSYQSDIYDAVTGSVALTALIGERFSWDVADPSTTAPYIVAQTVANSANGDLSGVRDTSFPIIQVTCWATTKAAAIEVMNLFESEIAGRALTGDSAASLNFSNENSTYDPETRLFGEIRDFNASLNSNH